MKKFGLLLCAVLLALSLGGCGVDEVSGYIEYNGVQIADAYVENMRNMYSFFYTGYTPTDEELLATLARQQVQLDEAERLGIMPSKAEVETYYQENVLGPVMRDLGSDDPRIHEEGLFVLTLYQEQCQQLGMNHDEFCDYLINQWQRMMGMNALAEHFLSQTGLAPGEMSIDVYDEYVDDLLAQAASAAGRN